MGTLFQDLRYGLRQLRHNPGFTAVAVITLALGIGANTAIFSLINAIMLRALPVRNPEQLVSLSWLSNQVPGYQEYSDFGGCATESGVPSGCSFSFPTLKRVRAQNHTLSGLLACAGPTQVNVIANGQAGLARAELVSGDFFSTLGLGAEVGRALAMADDQPGAEPVVVISNAYWERRFGRDPSMIGKAINLNGVPFRIVGVVERKFSGLAAGVPWDMYLPLHAGPRLRVGWAKSFQADNWWLRFIGRLKPGVSEKQAQADLSVMFRQTVTADAKPLARIEDNPRIKLMPGVYGIPFLRNLFAKPLFILLVTVGVVLLAACANIANLLLARGAARRREIAIRLALGARRARVARQLLTESLMLASAGGALGVLLAGWVGSLRKVFILPDWLGPLALDVSPDAHLLGFTAGVSLFTAVLFGLAPALRSTEFDLTAALKANRGPASGPAAHARLLRQWLVVFQVAVSLLLLISAGLFVRTLRNLRHTSPGFDPHNLLLFAVNPSLNGYDGKRLSSLLSGLQTRISSLPGVESASYAADNLIGLGLEAGEIYVQGDVQRTARHVNILRVGPGFFETMKIPLLTGRTVEGRDLESKRKVAVVNDVFARRYLAGRNPIGSRFGWEQSGPDMEIVGVVANAKYDALREEVLPTIYLPYPAGGAHFQVRTLVDPQSLVPAVRRTVAEIDRTVPVSEVKTQTEEIDQSLFQERLIAALSSLFGLLAALLACIGLYGIVSYGVVSRTSEIGIRMALGAGRSEILGMVMRESLLLVLAGVAIGILGALAATRIIASQLYGLKPYDPATFAAASVLLSCVALLASYIPARRATKVAPMVALRYE